MSKNSVYYIKDSMGAYNCVDMGTGINTQSLALRWLNNSKPFGNFVKDTIVIINAEWLLKNGKDSVLVPIGDFKQRQIICSYKDMMKILVDKLGILVNFKEQPVMVITDIVTDEVLYGIEGQHKEVIQAEITNEPDTKTVATISDTKFHHVYDIEPKTNDRDLMIDTPLESKTLSTESIVCKANNTAIIFLKTLKDDLEKDLIEIDSEITKYTDEISRLEALVSRLQYKQDVVKTNLKRVEAGLSDIEGEFKAATLPVALLN